MYFQNLEKVFKKPIATVALANKQGCQKTLKPDKPEIFKQF